MLLFMNLQSKKIIGQFVHGSRFLGGHAVRVYGQNNHEPPSSGSIILWIAGQLPLHGDGQFLCQTVIPVHGHAEKAAMCRLHSRRNGVRRMREHACRSRAPGVMGFCARIVAHEGNAKTRGEDGNSVRPHGVPIVYTGGWAVAVPFYGS